MKNISIYFAIFVTVLSAIFCTRHITAKATDAPNCRITVMSADYDTLDVSERHIEGVAEGLCLRADVTVSGGISTVTVRALDGTVLRAWEGTADGFSGDGIYHIVLEGI